ncbi:hypothetical protein F5B20DRAFT_523915 [Whalleya microplaca]|nr:hypothetical protein F5B20DRAFT_523915 [Whalleya microplaca]
MERGLDELIESLLTEIAFSGTRGCSVGDLLKAIESFYQNAHDELHDQMQGSHGEERDANDLDDNTGKCKENVTNPDDTNAHDLIVASKVWRWLVARTDVSVGVDREFNHVSLEEVLAIPEKEDDHPISAPATNTARNQPITSQAGQSTLAKDKRKSRGSSENFRPRLHVSEERQWKTIAGHSPDLKRIPVFEWKALVDIASTKRKGILQGDLVRLTGQDKRSLPTRTDALARKGYVTKQPVILRGCRSSKLWLTQFANHPEDDDSRDGLDFNKVDLSKETLTKDLEPVPFCDIWNGEKLDYIAIAQCFNAVVKAWGVIRYCDVRAKLGVEERVPQMRALSKTSRWFTSIGAVTFVAAKFVHTQRLFKDCVKFIREPTPEEWNVFRTTPKAQITVPSQRIGKRGEASRARHRAAMNTNSTHRRAKTKHISYKEQTTQSSIRAEAEAASAIASLWTPQKPITNTVFEIIKRAGSKGSSNAEVGRSTLGHDYRKYIAALTGALSLPNSQPEHLEHLGVTSQLTRVRKTMTYQFFADSELDPSLPEKGAGDQGKETRAIAGASDRDPSQHLLPAVGNTTFSQPVESKFAEGASLSLSQLTKTYQIPRPRAGRVGRKRKRPLDDEPSKDTPPKQPTDISQAVGQAGALADVNYGLGGNQGNDSHMSSSGLVAMMGPQQELHKDSGLLAHTPSRPPPRPPGVYREPNNMLDPPRKGKGRPRNSLVLTFRFDALKDPLFFEKRPNGNKATPSSQDEPSPAENSASNPPQATVTETDTAQATQGPPKRGKRPRAGGNKQFQCETCGNSWKNPGGLEYHLKKSQSACNPTWVPPPPKPDPPPKVKPPKVLKVRDPVQPQVLTPEPSQHAGEGSEGLPTLPSKRGRQLEGSVQTSNSEELNVGSIRSSLILLDVQAYGITDWRQKSNHAVSSNAKASAAHPSQRQKGILQETSAQPSKWDHQTLAYTEAPRTDEGAATLEVSSLSAAYDILPNFGQEVGSADVVEGQVESHHVPSKQKQQSNYSSTYSNLSLIDPALISSSLSGDHLAAETAKQPVVEDVSLSSGGRGTDSAKPQLFQSASRAEAASDNGDRPPQVAKRSQDKTGSNPSTSRPNDSSSKSKVNRASLGAQRRERASRIVQYLLDENDGVFPGQRSLYLTMASLWAKEYNDIGPPDWKVFQSLVNKMDKEGQLKQLHFCFVDDHRELQDCCVIVKARPGESPATDLSTDPKVVMIKEKMREMYPQPYIPAAFSLSQKETELYDALAMKYRETLQRSQTPTSSQEPNVTQDIEILHYPMPVMVDISGNSTNSKRPLEEDEDSNRKPIKRARIDVDAHEKPPSTLKQPRKRTDAREYWDTGKVATYIWNQKQNLGGKWDQRANCLQNFATGAWSSMPEEITPAQHNIDAILSSVQSIDANPSSSKQRRPYKRQKTGGDASKGRRPRMHSKNDDSEDDDEETPRSGGNSGRLLTDRFVKPSTSTSFLPEVSESDEDQDTSMDGLQRTSAVDDQSNSPEEFQVRFAESYTLEETPSGCWPWKPTSFFDSNPTSFNLVGNMPDSRWLQRENLPSCAEDIIKTARGKFGFWADPLYGKFLRQVDTIERWELSAEGTQVLSLGSIAPPYIFMSLTADITKSNMKPIVLEWPSGTQYTAENIPDEIKNALTNDVTRSLPKSSPRKTLPKKDNIRIQPMPQPKQQPIPRRRKYMRRIQITGEPKSSVDYQTRWLAPIPIQHKGRVNNPRPNENKVGLNAEGELIAAFVVFKTLLGGVDKIADLGSILKIFPDTSVSSLKRFWIRANKQRKTYIEALTLKFQSAFLEAYEKGEIAPLDYDDIDSYDWRSLVIWTSKLETHEAVELPESRRALDQDYSLQHPSNEVVDWRETWFSPVSVYARVEATVSEPASVPLGESVEENEEIMSLARSWVRSLSCTTIDDAGMPEKIRSKLLGLADGNETETNRLLRKVVDRLSSERVTARAKGKILGQSFRLHATFVKLFEKASNIEKYMQAVAFKALLDESFRQNEEVILPYAADDGTIMAMINLQAHGRLRIEAADIPHIPFGFEPGNYEGRTFPKSYYHFKIKLRPTSTYIYNEDMAIFQQARSMEVPSQGPRGEIPIWYDFFGRLDRSRWIDYLCVMVFALATKGPLTPKSASVLLRPFIDEFEAKLIMDWVDRLGLLQRFDSEEGATVGEWWWLVVGKLVDMKWESGAPVAREVLLA